MDLLCRIELFGQLKVVLADQELTRFRTYKIGWILAYLALHLDQNVLRERLLELFWPEMDLDAGRGNLNNALSSLRRQLEPPGLLRNSILIADRQHVRINPQAVRTDVQEFEELLQNAARATSGPQRISLLERAAGLYRGELLSGCYEDWAGKEQRRLHELYIGALDRWSEALEQAGELSVALSVIQRAVKADAYREDLYRRQIHLYMSVGQPAAALECYQQMERLFEADLGIPPSAHTQKLVQQLLRNPRAVVTEHAPPTEESSIPDRGQTEPASGSDSSPAPSSQNTVAALPLSMTRFFGRTTEAAQLIQMFTGEETRLVTIVGPGGAGKTRLSLEVARQLGSALSGRVWWVPLADLPDVRLLPYVLARALKLSVNDVADPLEPILARLNEASCLLVLDNFEHLLRDELHPSKGDPVVPDTGTVLIRLLLERAPHLRCLVTSRRALRLNGEQEFPLASLPLPAISAVPEEVLAAASVSLYDDRAKLARPDFAITANNAEAVARICRMLEGIPLAIEMAAAWARVLPPARMLERLEERLDMLTSRRRDLPARHQSLRATIDWSYDLLDAPQRRVLARLSVFRNGWSLEAAEAICADFDVSSSVPAGDESSTRSDRSGFENGDVLDILTSLIEKSLVISEEEEGEARYRLLETVRQYGRDRLKESGETARMQARHYAFFMEMAEASWDTIRSDQQIACLDRLEREHDNMRAALVWSGTKEGRQHAGIEAELNLAGRLRPFWDMRSYWREGRERLAAALGRETSHLTTEIQARALLGAGVLASNMGDNTVAQDCYEACLTIRRRLGDRQGIGSVAMAMGNIAMDEEDYAAAHRWYEESLEVARELDDRWFLGTVLSNLVILADSEDDAASRQRYDEEALMLHRQAGDLLGIAITQINLSAGVARQGNFPVAYAALAESLILLQKLGDRRVAIGALLRVGYVESLQKRFVKCARCMGAAQRIMEEIGAQPDTYFYESMAEARQDLGDEALRFALTQGRAMGMEQAIEDALTTVREAQAIGAAAQQ